MSTKESSTTIAANEVVMPMTDEQLKKLPKGAKVRVLGTWFDDYAEDPDLQEYTCVLWKRPVNEIQALFMGSPATSDIIGTILDANGKELEEFTIVHKILGRIVSKRSAK